MLSHSLTVLRVDAASFPSSGLKPCKAGVKFQHSSTCSTPQQQQLDESTFNERIHPSSQPVETLITASGDPHHEDTASFLSARGEPFRGLPSFQLEVNPSEGFLTSQQDELTEDTEGLFYSYQQQRGTEGLQVNEADNCGCRADTSSHLDERVIAAADCRNEEAIDPIVVMGKSCLRVNDRLVSWTSPSCSSSSSSSALHIAEAETSSILPKGIAVRHMKYDSPLNDSYSYVVNEKICCGNNKSNYFTANDGSSHCCDLLDCRDQHDYDYSPTPDAALLQNYNNQHATHMTGDVTADNSLLLTEHKNGLAVHYAFSPCLLHGDDYLLADDPGHDEDCYYQLVSSSRALTRSSSGLDDIIDKDRHKRGYEVDSHSLQLSPRPHNTVIVHTNPRQSQTFTHPSSSAPQLSTLQDQETKFTPASVLNELTTEELQEVKRRNAVLQIVLGALTHSCREKQRLLDCYAPYKVMYENASAHVEELQKELKVHTERLDSFERLEELRCMEIEGMSSRAKSLEAVVKRQREEMADMMNCFSDTEQNLRGKVQLLQAELTGTEKILCALHAGWINAEKEVYFGSQKLEAASQQLCAVKEELRMTREAETQYLIKLEKDILREIGNISRSFKAASDREAELETELLQVYDLAAYLEELLEKCECCKAELETELLQAHDLAADLEQQLEVGDLCEAELVNEILSLQQKCKGLVIDLEECRVAALASGSREAAWHQEKQQLLSQIQHLEAMRQQQVPSGSWWVDLQVVAASEEDEGKRQLLLEQGRARWDEEWAAECAEVLAELEQYNVDVPLCLLETSVGRLPGDMAALPGDMAASFQQKQQSDQPLCDSKGAVAYTQMMEGWQELADVPLYLSPDKEPVQDPVEEVDVLQSGGSRSSESAAAAADPLLGSPFVPLPLVDPFIGSPFQPLLPGPFEPFLGSPFSPPLQYGPNFIFTSSPYLPLPPAEGLCLTAPMSTAVAAVPMLPWAVLTM
ncbi:hypothetical protein CEUSTIGMA_g13688.t1 [Chlamydomonas eustigma]|uniref:Uncharacterized protein n=1 Tax=Chlamydomonas eustigma TaxID=1157962 RepID=A0A250XTA8_9CHLO|nr:hypothetical protein CEUSTIGMA_g13688.t1 [Chlamydomonas eustigma]|eukprot:GAX86276.1 hypothetical protein CEUSTIGMA_g13688.t1 [Chlamydomonas eustigma]